MSIRYHPCWKIYDQIPDMGRQSRLPEAGFGPRLLEIGSDEHGPVLGTVSCLPPSRGKHRLMVRCGCGRDIPIGRMGQHEPACPAEWRP